MSDEELVKHCMCGCMYLEAECPNCNKVTDADRIEELEAKLAKAVEALRYYAVEAMPWEADDSLIARATLAEIESNSNKKTG